MSEVIIHNTHSKPFVVTIPSGQWSGSNNDYYITVNASNVTANSILIPNYDASSSSLINGTIWCVPGEGSFTIHTDVIPDGTVTILVQFPGTMGEADYQVLSDTYSKDQTDLLLSNKLNKDGDTMTGSLTVQGDGITLTNTSISGLSESMHIAADGLHGIVSNGYYNGQSFVSDIAWLVTRNSSGKIQLGNAPIQIDNGGTGATDAPTARANLGALGTSDIVNDLTTGGTNKPLSAEMGKTLGGRLRAGANDVLAYYQTVPAGGSLDITLAHDVTDYSVVVLGKNPYPNSYREGYDGRSNIYFFPGGMIAKSAADYIVPPDNSWLAWFISNTELHVVNATSSDIVFRVDGIR